MKRRLIDEKVDYIHNNPVIAGYVAEAIIGYSLQ
jgi:hypothetical protein